MDANRGSDLISYGIAFLIALVGWFRRQLAFLFMCESKAVGDKGLRGSDRVVYDGGATERLLANWR